MQQNRVYLTVFCYYTPVLSSKTASIRNISKSVITYLAFNFLFKLWSMEHGTNHHRYGYEEKIAYMNNKHKCPIKTGNDSFNIIADKIYCAALTYDELTLLFYPEYETRCSDFMEIWKCYEHGRKRKC